MNQEQEKKDAALASLAYIQDDCNLGLGTGSTVKYLIENLHTVKEKINTLVSSSKETTCKLQDAGFRVDELSAIGSPDLYIDGADEVTHSFYMIKGGGGALTREKIIAAASKKIICIVDSSKIVDVLGKFPLPVEVIPMAKSYVAREIITLEGQPEFRNEFITDNGNIILDVHNLSIIDPPELEKKLNNIPGIVSNGIFASNAANVILVGKNDEVLTFNNQ
jgi:ribose 5-phosphate isomerase A|tara:strand:- start:9 stop:671 length:663 start_codon:yes stop_codon:yes gene_type:complete